ncbi:MAG: UDP-N-acetylmuramoyl-L-alanyl-D-glutamate--2,6-diaminopimelate ligase [Anderseniella sp.]|nr:UDP-N-acetylmuramoyl-L-alanyl-D-glutamate--2,6-diaminopimelate ligase [Anderseniella sp.]
MTLQHLAQGIAEVPQTAAELVIEGLTSDSRKAGEGFVFVAIPGELADGASFAKAAVANGAVAVVAGHDAELNLGDEAVILRTDNPRLALSLMAARLYAPQPDIVVAVTGTNGKTSVASFVRQIWSILGLPAASVGTVGIVSPSGTRKLAHTTPDPVEIHGALQALSAEHVSHVALEASSHGLAQYRLHGVRVAAAGFTNLTRDHLDYHKTFEAYLDAKMMLFEEVLGEGASAIINTDMLEAETIIARCNARGLVVSTVGTGGKALQIVSAEPQGFGQQLRVKGRDGEYSVYLPLVGRFQADNAVMAVALVVAAGGSEPHAVRALEQLRGATGRLELVATTHKGAPVFVDYAHTPDALEHALDSLRPYVTGKLYVVFGAGGDRDKGKRPEMGAVAARAGDIAIVTDDNPRSEEPSTIRAEIMAACPGAIEIGDRADAIATAIGKLEQGDVLVVAGKGHETGQTVGKTVIPFSDHEAVLACTSGQVANG